jgi:hypothetical protein
MFSAAAWAEGNDVGKGGGGIVTVVAIGCPVNIFETCSASDATLGDSKAGVSSNVGGCGMCAAGAGNGTCSVVRVNAGSLVPRANTSLGSSMVALGKR